MFTIEELEGVVSKAEFQTDLGSVKQSLVNYRLKQPILLDAGAGARLSRFVEAVLASAPDWTVNTRSDLCRVAAEIGETLASRGDAGHAGRLRVRSCLLYELASLPALSSAVLKDGDLPKYLLQLFRHQGTFSTLDEPDESGESAPVDAPMLAHLAFVDDARLYALASHASDASTLNAIGDDWMSQKAWKVGTQYNLGMSATEIRAFACIMSAKQTRATVSSVESDLIPQLSRMHFPVELLPAQKAAIERGLLNREIPSWGFAAPTGAGKTYLSRLLIAETLSSFPDGKIVYLVPSKALVSEVAAALGTSLHRIGYSVMAMSAQLVDLDGRERSELDDASVVVMTPEKADLLLRLGAAFLEEVRLAIIDEAHHIESGTRGVLLELYLWRLRRLLSDARFVFLSAVAPNIEQICRWMDRKGSAVTYNARPTRMRVGVYSISGKGEKAQGVIRYADGTSVVAVPGGAEPTARRAICQLSCFLKPAGPVLVVAKGKKECENIAVALEEWIVSNGGLSGLSEAELSSECYRTLDACLEREMYADVPLRGLVRHRIAYHHAGMPPSVRQGVERAIRERQIDYVVATTTLAEGVNFPFSSVVVQSLAIREPPESGRPSRYVPITPRTFWNIAGRAGRPGFDAEGQAILFEPTVGLERIKAVLEDYTNPNMAGLAPVKSALASAIEEIGVELRQQNYTMEELRGVSLPKTMSKRARGAINLLRVGILHAQAADLIGSPEEIVENSFAAYFLDQRGMEFAKEILLAQAYAADTYIKSGNAPSIEKLAELGLSLETLSDLRTYVMQMDSWQISNLQKLFHGGVVNIDLCQYVVGPVAKRMAELEGPTLGGFLSNVIVRWLSGVTFTAIRSQSGYSRRLEDLIAVIYSRVQFLLPWGLWATDWLIEQEAVNRGINYDNQVKSLAYLADAGVPSFDALQLVHLGVERVDATRLGRAYRSAGGLQTGLDCLGWVLSQTRSSLEKILHGRDNRRLDYQFHNRLDGLRGVDGRQ